MATIKSYTSLEQSRKLAEILPLESADMYYTLEDFIDEDTGNVYSMAHAQLGYPSNDEICCWSFTALFVVLPKNLNIGRPSLESNYMGYYWIQYYDEFMKPNNYKTESFNNPIDACYEMILKLHELNLL